MKAEAQRIAIAEACGWTHIVAGPGFAEDPPRKWPRGESPLGPRLELPDYLISLDAMHDAEKVLARALIPEWERHIRQITQRDAEEGTGLYERIIRATAPQRAEAFLKTIGKWQEAKGPDHAK